MVRQNEGHCLSVPPGWLVINHAPHLSMEWDWFHVPDADVSVWNHQNVYNKHFNLAADQPGRASLGNHQGNGGRDPAHCVRMHALPLWNDENNHQQQSEHVCSRMHAGHTRDVPAKPRRNRSRLRSHSPACSESTSRDNNVKPTEHVKWPGALCPTPLRTHT